MKTVAAISFRNDHSLSMDVEGVHQLQLSEPIMLDDGTWMAELLIRSDHGTVALQLQADDPARLDVKSFRD